MTYRWRNTAEALAELEVSPPTVPLHLAGTCARCKIPLTADPEGPAWLNGCQFHPVCAQLERKAAEAVTEQLPRQ